jgi:hypothetical protein
VMALPAATLPGQAKPTVVVKKSRAPASRTTAQPLAKPTSE